MVSTNSGAKHSLLRPERSEPTPAVRSRFALRAGVNRGRGEDASSDSHDPVLVTSRCWGDDKRSRLLRVLEIYRKGVGGAGRVPFQALELPVRVPTQSPGCRTFARASAVYLRTTKSLRSSRDSANSRGYGPAKTAKASSGRLFPSSAPELCASLQSSNEGK